MARPRADTYDETRRGILEKSAGAFARRGYANTTINDLAEANGISRGLLYHYFSSKEALLHEMLTTHLDYLLEELTGAAGGDDPLEDRFRRTVGVFVRINAETRDLQIVLLHDLQNLAEAERAEIVGKQDQILDVIAGLVGALVPDRDRATSKARTMMLIGMINYTYLWYDPEGPVGPGAYARMVADTFLRGQG